MKHLKKVIALVLALVMCVGVFAACGKKDNDNGTNPANPNGSNGDITEPTGTADDIVAYKPTDRKDASYDGPLVVGKNEFSEKFSPFFAESSYDVDVYGMTALSLFTTDRVGQVVENGIQGETRKYNGTDYNYYGPANLKVTENADGTVTYDIKLRDDLSFSDGDKLTIDDVIFTMYVLCDPTFDGPSTFSSLPIKGLEEYRSGMDTLLNLIYNAGRENTDFTFFTEEQQKDFWTKYDNAAMGLATEIVDYCVAKGYADEGDVATAAGAWGFSGNTLEEFAAALQEAYKSDIAGMISTENAGSTVDDLFPGLGDYSGAGIKTGESAANISGIEKIDDYNMRVILTKVDAPAIYELGVVIAPLHYYGDAAKYDYANNKFGFDKGDLSKVRSVTRTPMGAGPYKFVKYENNVVTFEANENYYLGAPYIKNLQFKAGSDKDKLNGVVTGTIDITDPSFNGETIKAVKEANGLPVDGDEMSGDKITVSLVDFRGYGYIGICADRVKVGDDKGSDASKNLRKAFATIFSVYRELAIKSYYGERASVINYPISNTSWAAPQSADDDYQVAFSVDKDGNAIYTSDMTDEQKYEAALKASLGFFEAAGYTVEDGKITAAPEGASLTYEFWIPADGIGDHPSFQILSKAHEALATIGIDLVIKDLANSSALWDGLDSTTVDMWAAAWQSGVDPDMTQVYSTKGNTNHYKIADADLDKTIEEARNDLDQSYRKTLYKQCLDIVVDWAVEVPTYQRKNAVIFSTERVNMDSIITDITPYYGWDAEIQNVELK